jgi:mannose-6-phosphate isomerase-like protein (cupin superfamily)
MESTYQVFELGAPDTWSRHVGGAFNTSGRRILDRGDLPLEYFGVSVNERKPGEWAGYWHSHSLLEELYLFIEGEGEMALDEKIVTVKAGTAIRVGQNVMRTWRCSPRSPSPLRWICIRGAGAKLSSIPRDAEPITSIPQPW